MMKLKIRMKLLSDTVFGNGVSVPGGEDISILYDDEGFPYYKGGTLKGVFREELRNYLNWTGEEDPDKTVTELLGKAGDAEDDGAKLFFSDLTIPEDVRKKVLLENLSPEEVLDIFSDVRMFTALDDDGIAKKGSLRMARCVIRGISCCGEIECPEEHKDLVIRTLKCIKWIGTLRNRGFGHVEIREVR